MGLVLDSSALIAAEREARPVSELLASLSAGDAETESLRSSISVIEHGGHSDNTPEIAAQRRHYLDEAPAGLLVEPLTHELAIISEHP